MPKQIRYYLYISRSKLEMLSSQLRRGFFDRLSGSIDINLVGVVKTSFKQEAAGENQYAELERVVGHLRNHVNIGTVDEPKGYFFGEGESGWGIWRNTATGEAEHVFFILSSGRTLLVLAGSAGNIIGDAGIEFRSRSNLTDILAFLNAVAQDSVPVLGENIAETARRAYEHLAATSASRQEVTFMAKRLAQFETNSGKSVLIGSPIFVASAD